MITPALQIPVWRINNCPPASRIFQGRADILNQMQAFFSVGSDNQHIFLLHGLGGAGKTQIALRFIEQSSSGFSDIFMVDATTAETIEADFQRIALAKNSGSTMPDALKWLVSTPEEWLLLFDSADDSKMDLNKFFPQCKHGNILITSRNPGLRVYAGSHYLVSDMDGTDAVNLLLKSATEPDTNSNREIAAEIVKTLCYLPLAIIQAGAFISKSGALCSYLELYVSNKAKLLSEKPAQSHDDYRWTVYTTWQISFNQLSKPAATLLQFCSFLHHQGISEEIFSKASGYRFSSDGPTEEELQQPVEFLSQFLSPDGTWDPLRFIDLTSEIRSYSLVNLNPRNKEFSIHPLVHEWTRSVLSDEEACHNCMCAILGMGIAEIPYWDMTVASMNLLPHVDSILYQRRESKPDFDRQFSRVYHHGQRYQDALHLNAKVLEQCRKILRDDHPDTLHAMANLAITYWELGHLTEAAELEIVVLEQQRKILGDDHPATLTGMNNLAATYCSRGQLKEAADLQVLVLEKRRKILGDDHPDTLIAMAWLASIYRELGKLKEAMELEVVVLEKRRKILGDDHPHTLQAMANLAETYYDLGQFTEAAELEVVVLDKRRKILGDDHPDTLLAMANLALTFYKLGQLKEA
ncbi:P-loop containing nucleoside triphosphate hydrolase protein [Mycena crocata]|nr:P-loop containing nucleoside triphosphate hydrolase protein [Mycena crocata]